MAAARRCSFIAALLLAAAATAAEPVVTPVPAELRERMKLAPFYKKVCDLDGFAILSSEKTSDYALLEAAHLLRQMTAHRPEVLASIARKNVRLAIMAAGEFTADVPEHSQLSPRDYWDRRARGLGAAPDTLTTSCGEENLLGFPGDPYASENILIHEFGHVIHEFGMRTVDPTFDKRLAAAWGSAMERGLWRGKYASVNRMEYWAEGVQSWFDTNREDDHDHNHVNTRAELRDYDAGLAALCEEVLGDGTWRYARPAARSPAPPHLAGYDPTRAPRFEWPARVIEWEKKFRAGEVTLAPQGAMRLAPLPADARESWRSPGGGKATAIYFLNASSATVRLDWIDFDGKPAQPRTLRPREATDHRTFAGHIFRISAEDGTAARYFVAGEETSDVVVK